MPAWLRGAAGAARLVADRPDLWLPGALAALATYGALPLLLAVVPLPTLSDLTFWGAGMVSAPSFPLNVVALSLAAAMLLLGLRLVGAIGELSLLEALA